MCQDCWLSPVNQHLAPWTLGTLPTALMVWHAWLWHAPSLAASHILTLVWESLMRETACTALYSGTPGLRHLSTLYSQWTGSACLDFNLVSGGASELKSYKQNTKHMYTEQQSQAVKQIFWYPDKKIKSLWTILVLFFGLHWFIKLNYTHVKM